MLCAHSYGRGTLGSLVTSYVLQGGTLEQKDDLGEVVREDLTGLMALLYNL